MGKEICKILKKKEVGSIGIGAMIVFIAMVLVAGIAASVLVQTANRLEIRAMSTGQQTTAEVATGIKICDIEGHVYSSASDDLDKLAIMVAPRAGSSDIDLSEAYVEITNTDLKCVLTYLSTEFHEETDVNGDIFQPGFFDGLNATKFGVIILEDADDSLSSTSPVINRGDKVLITIHCNASKCFGDAVVERTDILFLSQ
jgi:flagellin FlaB